MKLCSWYIWWQSRAIASTREKHFQPNASIYTVPYRITAEICDFFLEELLLSFLFFCHFNDCIRIITTIRQKNFGFDAANQFFSRSTIRCGTFCNRDSERHTMRIHGQMYLAVEPPFVFAIS